jgi:hypothetical protein
MDKIDWIIRSIFVLLAGFVFMLTLKVDTGPSTAYLVMNLALFVTLTAYLLLPVPKSPGGSLLNSGACVLLFLVLSQVTAHETIPAQVLYRIGVVMLGFSLSLWSLNRLLTAVLSDSSQSRNSILLAAVIVISAPVWLGPLVEISQPGDSILNSIISVTPLTHFSVAAEYDYLRSAWFYHNTPFGSLPFAYPDLINIAVAYLALVVLLQIVCWRVMHTVTDPIRTQRHSLTNS